MGWLADLYGHTLGALDANEDTKAFANSTVPVERIDFHIERYRQAILACTEDARLDPLLTGLSYWRALRAAQESE